MHAYPCRYIYMYVWMYVSVMDDIQSKCVARWRLATKKFYFVFCMCVTGNEMIFHMRRFHWICKTLCQPPHKYFYVCICMCVRIGYAHPFAV